MYRKHTARKNIFASESSWKLRPGMSQSLWIFHLWNSEPCFLFTLYGEWPRKPLKRTQSSPTTFARFHEPSIFILDPLECKLSAHLCSPSKLLAISPTNPLLAIHWRFYTTILASRFLADVPSHNLNFCMTEESTHLHTFWVSVAVEICHYFEMQVNSTRKILFA